MIFIGNVNINVSLEKKSEKLKENEKSMIKGYEKLKKQNESVLTKIDVISLFELNKNEQEKALTYVFSHIYIPNYQEEIYDKEIMIEKINIRFDNPNAMLEKYYKFCNSFSAKGFPLLYVFKKKDKMVGYYIVKDSVHKISNEDELSKTEQFQVSMQIKKLNI